MSKLPAVAALAAIALLGASAPAAASPATGAVNTVMAVAYCSLAGADEYAENLFGDDYYGNEVVRFAKRQMHEGGTVGGGVANVTPHSDDAWNRTWTLTLGAIRAVEQNATQAMNASQEVANYTVERVAEIKCTVADALRDAPGTLDDLADWAVETYAGLRENCPSCPKDVGEVVRWVPQVHPPSCPTCEDAIEELDPELPDCPSCPGNGPIRLPDCPSCPRSTPDPVPDCEACLRPGIDGPAGSWTVGLRSEGGDPRAD